MSQCRISIDIKRNPLNAQLLVYPPPPPFHIREEGEELHVYAKK